MANFELMRELAKKEGGKIVLLVMDGLGGLPMGDYTQTTLEYANTPNMDRLATEGCLGLSHPIARGITPGSGWNASRRPILRTGCSGLRASFPACCV